MDLTDLSIFAADWHKSVAQGDAFGSICSDINGDGYVDLTDMSILAKNWGWVGSRAARRSLQSTHPSTASGTATIAASPASGSFNQGDTFSVTINVAAGQSFSAVQANLAVSSNLTIQNISPGSCGLTNVVTPTPSVPNFAGAIMAGSSAGCTAYTLTLLAGAPGPATVSISGAEVMAYADGSNILSGVTAGSYCVGTCAGTDNATWKWQGTADGTQTNTVTLSPGQQVGYVVTICNSGTTTWTAPAYAPQWGLAGITVASQPTLRAGSVPDPSNIAPGQCPTWDMAFGPAPTSGSVLGTLQMAHSGALFGVKVMFGVTTTVPPPAPGAYHALPPARIYDTRGGPGPLSSGEARCIPVAGLGGVPGAGAAAAALNVTVTNPTAGGYLTVYPSGVARPGTSSLNFSAGETVPNLVVVGVGADGRVCLYSPAGSLDVVVDAQGWFGPASAPGAGAFVPLPPARILDTRDPAQGPALGAGAVRDVPVAGRGGVPAAGVAAVVLNVTVTNPTAGSYLTVFPAGGSPPLASDLNFSPGETVPNRVVVPVGAGGQISLYNALGSVDVVIDVNGWFADGTTAAAGGAFTPLTPARIFDSRQAPDGPALGQGEARQIQVAGRGGVPAGAVAVVANVTVTNPTAGSYLTAYPADVARPLASDLNFSPGETVPNLVVVALSAGGAIDVYNAAGSTDVVVDVVGWFGPPGAASAAR